ncbi:MAG: hypothetical protein U5L00_07455 [Desulfovermiculus sp.]|nr:hypothetical protein [Desulfovermiculus sp.]
MTTTKPQAQIPQEKATDGSPAGIEEVVITPFPFDAEKISISKKDPESWCILA